MESPEAAAWRILGPTRPAQRGGRRDRSEQHVDADLVLFYYTLFILLVSILTAAACAASYLVSRARPLLFAFSGFLFYFFDVALVFQDDFLLHHSAEATPFFIGSPLASIVIGGGALMSFWLAVCEYLDERRRILRWAPGAVFALASAAVLLLVKQGNVQEFAFYSMREAFLYWILLFAAGTYLTARDEAKRFRMARFRRKYAVLWVLVTLVLLENVVFLLVVDPSRAGAGTLPFFPERNFAENLLMLGCALAACRSAFRNLSLRHEDPPAQGGGSVESFIAQNLAAYCAARGLSKREEEVLCLVLIGKDNQNIATALQLAPGTVKVHVHHILQKTDTANRKELLQDFWSFS